MDDKMTSGEIAKKAGVSQKAVRLYDEKERSQSIPADTSCTARKCLEHRFLYYVETGTS